MVLGGIYALWLGQPLWAALLMSLVLLQQTKSGDLCESALKRENPSKTPVPYFLPEGSWTELIH